MDKIVAKDYKISKKLGSGAFGEVFLALNTKNHTEYAVKLEKASTKSPQLFYEGKILGSLQGEEPTTDYGFPNVYYIGSEGEYNVMVMDLCGKSL
jgi:serine/threonine protein kinase